MKPTIFLPTLAIAAVAACSSASAPLRDASSLGASAQSGPRTDTLSIQLGKSISVDGGRLEVIFEAKLADSRCPANATCVWAGDAVVRVSTRLAGGAPTGTELHSTLQPNSLKIDRYTISMIGLTPYPGTGRDAETQTLILRIASE
jgi:hypothetical protein